MRFSRRFLSKGALRRQLERHKVALLAVAFIVLGIFLLILGEAVGSRDDVGALIGALTDGGLPPEQAVKLVESTRTNTAVSVVLMSAGGTFVSVGVVSIAWDYWMNRTWLATVQHEILMALTRPRVIRTTPEDHRNSLLKALLKSRHGEELGAALLKQSDDLIEDESMIRSNFIYNIRLLERSAEFHQADLKIEFSLPDFPERLQVSFAQVSDSLQFHRRYQELLDDAPDALYRYILIAPTSKEASGNLFSVRACRVETRHDGNFLLEIGVPSTPNARQTSHVSLSAKSHDGPRWRAARRRAGEIKVVLDISTVVDGNRSEFPICLGYPVRNFRSVIDATGIYATEIDVLEFFTSSERFRRDDFDPPSSGESACTASGTISGLVLPESGLTYVWR